MKKKNFFDDKKNMQNFNNTFNLKIPKKTHILSQLSLKRLKNTPVFLILTL